MPHDAGHDTYPADYLSTLSSRELQRLMRDSDTRPLSVLINRGGFSVDYATRRVWRDCYWKGSFARDTIMGREERLLTPARSGAAPYAGGRFWKRFDDVRDGEARGLIVNYGLSWLPGRPSVREQVFPDSSRPYARGGDTVLLLTYLNQPYRTVYDLIKIVDDRQCIGVMHLGTYPRGRVFATFVMARNNYPFEKMTVPDHDLLFRSDHARAPQPAEVAGTWKGHVVFFRHPERALHNQFNPPLVRMRVGVAGDGAEAHIRVGPRGRRARATFGPDHLTLDTGAGRREHIRRLDDRTLLGRRTRDASATVTLRYVLTPLGP